MQKQNQDRGFLQFHELRVRPSTRLGLILLCSHTIALACLLRVNLVFGVKVILFVLLLASVLYLFSRHVRLTHPLSVTALRLSGKGWFYLRNKDTSWQQASLCQGSSYCLSLTALKLKQTNGSYLWVYLLPDSVDSNQLRQVRVYLRFCNRLQSASTEQKKS